MIGYGYWGPNLVRNFAETPGCKVARVSDLEPRAAGPVADRYPAIATTTDYRDLLDRPEVDAVVIATPVATHLRAAPSPALEAGKHVLVEKPLTPTSDQAARLIDEADRRGLRR